MAIARAASRSGMARLRGATVRGLEWWLQEQWPEDAPKEMHTDKAVGMAEADGTTADGVVAEATLTTQHPILSSVCYLSASGGPTAVFKGRAVALGFPWPASLLLFEGDLPHCVLHAPPPPLAEPTSEDRPRRTLLVNFWASRPPGATDVPLPSLPALPTALEAAFGRSGGSDSSEPTVSSTLRLMLTAGGPPTKSPRVSTPFVSHAPSWRRQQLPSDLSNHANLLMAKAESGEAAGGTGAGALPLVVIEYPPSHQVQHTNLPTNLCNTNHGTSEPPSAVTLAEELEALSLDESVREPPPIEVN